MEEAKTCPVLGTPLAVTDYAGAVERVREWAGRGDAAYCVAAANTHVVTLGRTERSFRETLDRFDLIDHFADLNSVGSVHWQSR